LQACRDPSEWALVPVDLQSFTENALRTGAHRKKRASTGGTKATGGTASTGGTKATGGTASTGGTKATGGTASTGGTKATGGTASTGGTKATGGTASTGGTKATGGTASTGGTKATGGTPSSGTVFNQCRFHFGTIDSTARNAGSSTINQLDFFTPGWMGTNGDTFDQSYVCDEAKAGGTLGNLVPMVVSYIAAGYVKRHHNLCGL
jgi:hypothetical protein